MKITPIAFLSTFVVLVSLTSNINAARFVLSADSKKCFTEDLNASTKAVLLFELEDIGLVLTSITLYSPDQTKIFSRSNPGSGKFQFTSSMSGPYQICVESFKEEDILIHDRIIYGDQKDGEDGEKIIQNELAEPRKVRWMNHDEENEFGLQEDDVLVQVELLTGVRANLEPKPLVQDKSLKPIEQDIETIQGILADILSNLQDMKTSEVSLRDQNESLNSKALWFSFLSSIIIISTGAYQVIHLKKFLVHKKVI
eukprot:TRINITY_DN14424_c0_g1_i1.p1 TRINITY_DN14424_c0_g1~~TRINITY_DN14424_c0_g1_i1.p1  ORF type:complete len:255 (-),score=75.36 TRINITY_DN14424_c0_g1_i1:85-849(-)